MKLDDGLMLRVYVDENDTVNGHNAYRWVVSTALEHGLAGATVLRGMHGYGSRQRMHSAGLMSLSGNLPVVIEIIDSEQNISEFVSVLEREMEDGLISVEKVRYHHLGKNRQD